MDDKDPLPPLPDMPYGEVLTCPGCGRQYPRAEGRPTTALCEGCCGQLYSLRAALHAGTALVSSQSRGLAGEFLNWADPPPVLVDYKGREYHLIPGLSDERYHHYARLQDDRTYHLAVYREEPRPEARADR